MVLHRYRFLLSAVALLTGISVLQLHGVQDPPRRPGMPVRDPGTATSLAAGTASLSGIVVTTSSGLPARRARVTLTGSETGRPRSVVADEQGRFAFDALPAGRYSLSASKPGHIAALYGQSRPGRPGTPIQLGEGQKFEARLQLTRGGVLTGTVLDEDGEPIPGTQVRALRYVLQNGQRTLQAAGSGAADDRGIYRIYGLQPGDYIVGATPRNTNDFPPVEALRSEMQALRLRGEGSGNDAAQLPGLRPRLAALQSAIDSQSETAATGYAPVYYPGTTALAQATPTSIGPGEERAELDFQLQRVTVARVEGLVVNSTGQPVQNIQVTLIDLHQAAPGIGNNTRADNEGRFSFSNVAPGRYRIAARAIVGEPGGGRGQPLLVGRGRGMMPGAPDQLRLWASEEVTIDGRDLTNVALGLQAGVSVSGRLVFQGTSVQPPADPAGMRVSALPMEFGPARELAGPASGRVDSSGKFTIPGITPGRYRLNASGAPQGWVLESAMVGGQDSLDFPFDVNPGQNVGAAVITFTDQRSELTGALVDSSGQPAAGYTLILYPADERYRTPQSRRIRTARAATDGRFVFGGLPAGGYRIAPVVDVEPGAWFDPAFLQELDAAALRVSIAEGEKKVQNVRIAGG